MTTVAARTLTRQYRANLADVVAHVRAQTLALWALVDAGDINGSWAEFAVPALQVTLASQTRAAAFGQLYLTGFLAAELGRPGHAPITPPSQYAGITTTGVPLPTALDSQRIQVLQRIGQGMPAQDALDTGERGAERLLATLTRTASNESLGDAMGASVDVVGWQRVTEGGCCDFCEMLAGRGAVYRAGTVDFLAHANDRCTAEPVVVGHKGPVQSRYAFAGGDQLSKDQITKFWSSTAGTNLADAEHD